MVGYFPPARGLKKTAQGLPSRDTNPQQGLWWTSAAAECGGRVGSSPPLARETCPKEGNDAGWALPIRGVLQGSESSLWLQSGEAVQVETLGDCVPWPMNWSILLAKRTQVMQKAERE